MIFARLCSEHLTFKILGWVKTYFFFFFFFFFLKRDWVWKDPLEDSNSVTLPVSGGGGNQGWNGGDVV